MIKRKKGKIEIIGSLSISKSIGPNGNRISIGVTDTESCTRFLSIELSLEEFSEVITGLRLPEIPMTILGLDRIGKKQETQRVVLPLASYEVLSDRKAFNLHRKKHLEQYRKDGWEDNVKSWDNHHNWKNLENGERGVNIWLHRLVKKTD